jgi:tripartite-type tricarboxylate transporter receptor subunit TctC
MRKLFQAAFVTALILTTISSAITAGPSYPSKRILILCPWAEGGGSDQIARITARLLEEELDQPVVVINRTGGNGAIAYSESVKAAPDGYTIIMATTELAMLHWMSSVDISYANFKPLALVNVDPAGVIVRSNSAWQNLNQLQQAIKANPGKLRASGTSSGGIWDLCRAGWMNAIELPPDALPWVASTGAAPSLEKLLGGWVDVVTCSLPEAESQIRSGKARALAIMGEKRNLQFPDVPTLYEQKIRFANGAFRGYVVPLETPDTIVRLLERKLAVVVKKREFQELMKNKGFTVSYKNSRDFGVFLQQKDQELGFLMKRLGFAK